MSDDGRARRRVLHVVKGLGPGGAEQLLVNQVGAAADDMAYDVLYAVAVKDHHVAALRDLGATVTCMPHLASADPRGARDVRAYLRAGNYDVVHVHSPLVAAAVRLATRTMRDDERPAVVYTEHNRWPRHHALTRLANRATMRLDDLDVAVSNDVRASMPEHLARDVVVLPHGIDIGHRAALRLDRDEVRSELGFRPDQIVVGIVANFRREKRYDLWLDVARRVIERRGDVVFVSVGQGPLEAEMRAVVDAQGLGERVRILGYRPDAARLMASFDIFTLTSDHEGLPVALMDALALGLPVVCTAVGGIPEAITNDVEGVLVPHGDAVAFADALVALVDDPQRRARYRDAATLRAESFDVRRAVAALEGHYRALADERSRSRSRARRDSATSRA